MTQTTETATRPQHTRRTMNEHKSEQKMKKSEQDEDERDGNVGLAYHKTLLSTHSHYRRWRTLRLLEMRGDKTKTKTSRVLLLVGCAPTNFHSLAAWARARIWVGAKTIVRNSSRVAVDNTAAAFSRSAGRRVTVGLNARDVAMP